MNLLRAGGEFDRIGMNHRSTRFQKILNLLECGKDPMHRLQTGAENSLVEHEMHWYLCI